MARPKLTKNLTPAEIKAQKADLKLALKQHTAATKELATTVKAVANGFEKAKAEADKAVATAQKSAEKAVSAATKMHDAEMKRLSKALEAAAKGKAKIETQLNALEPEAALV